MDTLFLSKSECAFFEGEDMCVVMTLKTVPSCPNVIRAGVLNQFNLYMVHRTNLGMVVAFCSLSIVEGKVGGAQV